jgi:mannose-1-phosphate guanylyltransferase
MHKRSTLHASRTPGNVFAVILIGGKGKRLRPLSTDERPKAFLSVTRNRRTMFRNTIDRIRRIIPDDNIVVVASKLHSKLVRKDAPAIKRSNLLLEPASRNTAPAIMLAAASIVKRRKDAVIVVLPTDHYISEEARQLECLRKGIRFMQDRRTGIVVLGLKPRYPSTQFGYIKLKPGRLAEEAGQVYRAEKFVEKPEAATAIKYLKSGKYLWNCGIFIFDAQHFIGAVKRHAPKIYNILKSGTASAAAYEKLPDISLDYAIMEKALHVYCVKGSYGWNDVGSFGALKKVLRREGRSFVEKDGKVLKIP